MQLSSCFSFGVGCFIVLRDIGGSNEGWVLAVVFVAKGRVRGLNG